METKSLYDYEVIVVGGGPAGLVLGYELSKSVKVLVLDKKKNVCKTDRSWFVPDIYCDNIKKYDPSHYEELISKKLLYPPGVKRFLINTFTGEANRKTYCKSANLTYHFVEEDKLLEYWYKEIMDNRNNDSTVKEECLYLDHVVENNIVHVKTSKGNFKGRLLVDASGYNSMIKKKYEIKEPYYYYWSVFGAEVKPKDGEFVPYDPSLPINSEQIANDGQLMVGDYMLWQTFESSNADPDASLARYRPVFEYEILKKDEAFPMILYLARDKVDFDTMREEFYYLLRNEESTKGFHDVEIKKEKWGWYPSGYITKYIAEDHVTFAGDSGGWTTPCGWGLGVILYKYNEYCSDILNALKQDKLKKSELEDLLEISKHEAWQIFLDKLIVHILSHGTVKQLNKMIDFFFHMDIIYCERVFTLTITKDQLFKIMPRFFSKFSFWEVMHILPLRDFPDIFRFIFYFIIAWFVNLFPHTRNKNKIAVGAEV